MKKTQYTEEQISFALRQADSGAPEAEAIRKMGITEPTFHRWKKQFAGPGVDTKRQLKQLEDENARLKRLVAGLILTASRTPLAVWVPRTAMNRRSRGCYGIRSHSS